MRAAVASVGKAWPLALAALLLMGSLLLCWPGVAEFDSVDQFGQVLSGDVNDWHPPVMVRWWGLLHASVGGGQGPMFLLQMAGYWLGLGLIASGLARSGRPSAALVVLAIGCWPTFLGWQAQVLKDAQLTGAALTAVGLIGERRLLDVRVPAWRWAGVAVLLGYATLVRANAVFATAPLAVLLVLPRRSVLAQAGLVLTATLAVLALSGPINNGLLGAEPSGVRQTEALYDLAGIAVRAPGAPDVGLTPAETRVVAERHCSKPFFWDPLGEPTRCDATVERLRDLPTGQLYRALATAVLHHPAAYLAHRLGHLNSTERWWVPALWPGSIPPMRSQDNDVGLGSPGRWAILVQVLAGWTAETPLSWPAVWTAVALVAALVAWRRPPGGSRDMALALAAGALGQEASFAVVSIASDLRYHLLSMVSAAVAAVLLADGVRRDERRALAIAGALVTGVALIGAGARLTLPAPPQSYQALLG